MYPLKTPLVLAVALSGLVPADTTQQPRGLKVFISVDMEGLAGVVSGSDVNSNGPDYPHFRKIMAGETNAAIEGAATRTARSRTCCRATSIRARSSCAVRAPAPRT
jgi:hypothetical protein